MSTPVKCFMVHMSGKLALYLRRYVSPKGNSYICETGWHQGWQYIKDVDDVYDEIEHCHKHVARVEDYKNHPDWPTKCEKCEYVFKPEDEWQVFSETLYSDSEGKVYVLRPTQPEFLAPGILLAPAGAMWDASWYHQKGPDGLCLVVITPDLHEWMIDSRASNCTMKDDNEHRCWVRHGLPPDVTVDKNGLTCGAGGGSIQTPKWHGFLRGGFLVEA